MRGGQRSTGKALERVCVGAVQPSGEVLVLGAVVPYFQCTSGSPGGWLKQIAGVLHPSHLPKVSTSVDLERGLKCAFLTSSQLLLLVWGPKLEKHRPGE